MSLRESVVTQAIGSSLAFAPSSFRRAHAPRWAWSNTSFGVGHAICWNGTEQLPADDLPVRARLRREAGLLMSRAAALGLVARRRRMLREPTRFSRARARAETIGRSKGCSG